MSDKPIGVDEYEFTVVCCNCRRRSTRIYPIRTEVKRCADGYVLEPDGMMMRCDNCECGTLVPTSP